MREPQPLSDEQLLRYSRHILLDGWDIESQQKLLASKALVIGAGGLGSPVILYLASAGVGELIIADGDSVELSNLQRQIAHGEADIGESKAESAARAVNRINSDCVVTAIPRRLEGDELFAAVAVADVVVDASDNFATRFAVNAACLKARVPLVSGAAIRTEGQFAIFDPRDDNSPCYRCLYDDSGDDSSLNCADSGVLSPFVGVIGSLQALAAVKLLANFGDSGHGALWVIDGRSLDIRKLQLPRDPECPACKPA